MEKRSLDPSAGSDARHLTAALALASAIACLVAPAAALAQENAEPATHAAPGGAPGAGSVAEQPARGEAGDGETGGEHRVVAGHRFVTPTFGYSAFNNAYFSFAQGFGVYDFTGVSLFTGAPQEARIFLYAQALQAQIGILNRVAIELSAGGAAAVGGDIETLLTGGALALLRAGAMPKVRIFTLDDIGLQASLGVGAFYSRTLHVSPAAIVAQTIESLATSGELRATIVQQQERVTVVPALMLAEGVGPFGAQLTVAQNIDVASSADKHRSLSVDAHAALDLGRLSRFVPFSLAAEYQLTADFGDEKLSHAFAGGLYYSGRRDVNLGVSGTYQPDGDTKFITGFMAIQYFF